MLQCLAGGPVLAAVEIWSRPDEFVRIEPQDDITAPHNEHPAHLAPEQVAAMLAALQVRFSDHYEPVPLFSSRELEVLGAALAEGLAKAGPEQDIRFATIGTHQAGRLLGRRLVNTGRAFYLDGKLNVLFGEVHGEYRKRNLYGRRDQDYRPRRLASRMTAAEPHWRLEPAPGVERSVQDGAERADWLRITPAPFATLPVTAPGAPIHRAAPATAVGAIPAKSVEERLAELQELHDKGLVPEEIYRARVEAILDEL